MERSYRIVTFDCYGTLVDWEAGISGAFHAAAARDGVRLERDRIQEAYAEIEPAVQAGEFRLYRDVLAETARRVASRLGWSLAPDRAGFLAESLPGWAPFPDTLPALVRLAGAGIRLGILSNVDDDLLDGTCRRLPVPFHLRITAQQVHSYKPGHAHFLAARERIGPEDWLHAAQSFFHDVRPARELGIPVAWINRKGESAPPGSCRPTREMRTLAELADELAGNPAPRPGGGEEEEGR
jgi:2-haloalkanoic acid dehalogenase type II